MQPALIFALDHAKDFLLRPLYRKIRQIQTESDVRVWKQHRRIPVLGWLLKSKLKTVKRSGKFAEFRDRQVVRSVRWFTDTKTFEDVVTLFFSSMKFGIRKPAKRRQPIHINTKVNLVL